MFRHPIDETDWNKIEEFGKLVVDMADGVVEERVSEEEDLTQLREALSGSSESMLQRNVQLAHTLFMEGSRVITDISNVALPLS